jgi:hypothetical protein
MSFLSDNLKTLGLHPPSGALTLPSEELEVVSTPSGELTAKYAGKWIHSPRNPKGETERIAEITIDGTEGCFIVLGFGLGYMTEYLVKNCTAGRIIVVEADTGCFLKALSSRHMRGFLSCSRLTFLLQRPPEELTTLLKDSQHDIIREVPLRGMVSVFEEYYSEVTAVIRKFRSRMQVNRNTLKRFGRLWVRNLTRNLPLLARYRGVGEIAGTFSGIPALLLAAGPSLDDILPILTRLREKMFIGAVDTALGPCLRAGVEPDAVIVVDPQYWNTRHLDNLKLKSAFLVSESSTHPKVFRLEGGGVFFGSSLFPLGRWIEKTLGSLGELGAGGSVATSAWDFLKNIGCGPVYCAGLDLGFPNSSTHVKGSFFEERTHTVSSRLKPAEEASFNYLHSGEPYLTDAAGDGKVLTDKRMEVYRWWFSNQLSLPDAPETYTLSPYSAAVEGMPYISLNEATELPDIRREIDSRVKNLLNTSLEKGHEEERLRILTETVSDLKHRILNLEEKALRGLEIAGKADPEEPVHAFKSLEKLDTEIGGDEIKDIAGFLMEDFLEEIKHSAGTVREALKTSRSLYAHLLDSCRYHGELLDRFLSERYHS